MAQPQPVDELGAAVGGVRVSAAHAPGELDVRLAGELGEQVEELEHEADVAPPQRGQLPLGRAGDVLARDLDRARLGAVQPAEQVQERRLAPPGAPQHGHDLARFHVEIGAVEHAPGGAALSEGLDEPAGAHHRHTGHGRAVVQGVVIAARPRWPPPANVNGGWVRKRGSRPRLARGPFRGVHSQYKRAQWRVGPIWGRHPARIQPSERRGPFYVRIPHTKGPTPTEAETLIPIPSRR